MLPSDLGSLLALRVRVFGVLGVSLTACAGNPGGDPKPDDTTAVTIVPTPGSNEVASAPLKSAGLPPSAPRKAWRSAEGGYCVVLADAPPSENDKPGTCNPSAPAKLHEMDDPPGGMYGFSYDQRLTDEERKRVHDACCYRVIRPVRGRPLREATAERAAVVAPIVARADWSERPAIGAASADPAAAASWAADAALEHASAAELCRLALGLMALGAPRELVEGALSASLSEVRHAALSFGVAGHLAGAPLGPGALPVAAAAPVGDLVELFEGTLADGCVGETLASLEAAAEAAASRDAALASALSEIARDEAGHAELSFKVADWALSVATPAQRLAMRSAIARARAELEAGALPCEGSRLPAARLEQLRGAALRELLLPALDVLEARAAA